MAGFSLLALLDDITTVLDDVALMTKAAAKKTAGVLGDDLALNAQQVAGVRAERELPVVWAVAKGSLVNKAILIPAALVISVLAPKLITPLLMLGGAYLCFEGAEKLAHKFLHKQETEEAESPPPDIPPAGKVTKRISSNPAESYEPDQSSAGELSLRDLEKKKIRGAVRTDFILSAEIIVIALGAVPDDATLALRAGILCLIGLVMTAGVYGLVGGIVKLDDLGFWLLNKSGGRGFRHKAGTMLVGAAPFLMRFLAVVGTAAMFLVGGGILAHGLPFFHHVFAVMSTWPVNWLWPALANAVIGLVAGAVILGIMTMVKKNA